MFRELRERLWRAKLLAVCESAHRVEMQGAAERGGIQEWSATWSRRFSGLAGVYRPWSAGRVRMDSFDEERLVSQRSFVTIDGNEAASLISAPDERSHRHLSDHAGLADGRVFGRLVGGGTSEHFRHGSGRHRDAE